MKHIKGGFPLSRSGLLCLLAALLLLLAACTSAAGAPSPTASASPEPTASAAPSNLTAENTGWFYRNGDSDWKARMQYTEADYALLKSFQKENYSAMSVEAFNASVFDWNDEDAFHQTEDALQRLQYTLPETDPLFPFLSASIRRTWDECEIKHYNACKRDRFPCVDATAQYERYGDVFGDKVLVAGGYADYWYHYEITDESKITVAERDAFVAQIADGMQAFLDRQSEKTLKRQEDTQKALKAELERLIAKSSTTLIKSSDGDVDYYWEQMN